jgi:apoptotic protease-activating factor
MKQNRSLRRRRPSENEVRAILIEGGVPPRPNVYEDRPEIIDRIREALYKVKDEPGWISIHGMGGCGKSVLAAESVRDAKVLSECFPGGVFWTSIGAIDQQKFLIKMQTLCTLLDSEESAQPRNIEEAKGRLRLIFAHQHPRALLILDDVWSQFVTKAFDIQCRILVTTRDETVMDKVSGLVTKVEMSSGFSEIQSLRVFSKWTATPVLKLPEHANKIYDETKGSPLAISMIGALLAEHPERWESYLNKLKSRKVSRFRKSSSYEYSSLEEAVSISITNLDDELKEFYQDFAVFVDDVKVPTEVSRSDCWLGGCPRAIARCVSWQEPFL